MSQQEFNNIFATTAFAVIFCRTWAPQAQQRACHEESHASAPRDSADGSGMQAALPTNAGISCTMMHTASVAGKQAVRQNPHVPVMAVFIENMSLKGEHYPVPGIGSCLPCLVVRWSGLRSIHFSLCIGAGHHAAEPPTCYVYLRVGVQILLKYRQRSIASSQCNSPTHIH